MEEEKKKKSLLSWRDAMKLGMGIAVGFMVISMEILIS